VLNNRRVTVPATLESLGLNTLSREERLVLVQALWDSIAAEGPHLTDAQRRELELRAEEDDAHPDDVIPWEQVKAKARAGFKS
jgi:putative addiction module component (TIGR02574 family)